MWQWTLNWGEISSSLLVGTCPMTPQNLETIHGATGASAVLCLQHEICLAHWGIDYEQMLGRGARLGLRMARVPMRDFDIGAQQQSLPRAVAALAALQGAGHRTYVHCTAGLGRGPLTILGFLVWVEGYAPQEAIRIIHRARPDAVPAWEAFWGCQGEMLQSLRGRIERRAYALYEARAGAEGDAWSDWLQAEREVLRGQLLGGDRGPGGP